MTERIKKVVANLKANNINCIIVEKSSEIPKIVEQMLFDGCTITAGGSVSVKESGVWDLINNSKYNFVDRNREGITNEERIEAYKTAIDSDFYFCSSNALTESGELVNVDGLGNRVASLAFGPKKVIAVIGINKLVKDVEEGFLRIKRIAAPKNCLRLKIDSPCSKLGYCVSLEKENNPKITDGCSYSRRICSSYLISGWQKDKDRMTVILCKEKLGY